MLQKIVFESVLSSPFSWLEIALELMDTAEALIKHQRKSKTPNQQQLLLIGYAFENLFKAYSISGNLHRKRFPKEMDSHDLLVLRSYVFKGNSTCGEKDFKNLTNFVIWQGRYPIAKDAKSTDPVDPAFVDIKAAR